MFGIASIVEGRGELQSVPVLIHRIKKVVAPDVSVQIMQPIRVQRNLIVKPDVFEHYLNMASQKGGPNGRILVLLDADDDCPKKLAENLHAMAREMRSDRIVKVVIAKSEFESWFVASIDSIAGKFSVQSDCRRPTNPEGIRDAKGWLSRQMSLRTPYRPMIHQSKMVRELSLEVARQESPSFDKFWRDIEALLSL